MQVSGTCRLPLEARVGRQGDVEWAEEQACHHIPVRPGTQASGGIASLPYAQEAQGLLSPAALPTLLGL